VQIEREAPVRRAGILFTLSLEGPAFLTLYIFSWCAHPAVFRFAL
jgi:hypothetical protein